MDIKTNNTTQLQKIIEKYDNEYYAMEMNLPIMEVLTMDELIVLYRSAHGYNDRTAQHITLRSLINDYNNKTA